MKTTIIKSVRKSRPYVKSQNRWVALPYFLMLQVTSELKLLSTFDAGGKIIFKEGGKIIGRMDEYGGSVMKEKTLKIWKDLLTK